MIPILLLDLAGVLLVIGYVLLDRRQNSTTGLPNEATDQVVRSAPSTSLPVEPIIAQRPLPSTVEPRRIRRPNRSPGGRVPSSPVTRSDEA